MSQSGWIAVDFDGTLATYKSGDGILSVGEPIPAMVERVKHWLSLGIEVRIMTARVGPQFTGSERADEDILNHQRTMLNEWCVNVFGQELPLTNQKDFHMLEQWDDRAITVEQNEGVPVAGCRPRSPVPGPA